VIESLFEDLLNGGLAVSGLPGMDGEVGEDVRCAGAVGVAAVDGEGLVRVLLHDRGEFFANRFGGEVGEPIVVRDSALVPAGFAVWGDVGGEDDVLVIGEGLVEFLLEG